MFCIPELTSNALGAPFVSENIMTCACPALKEYMYAVIEVIVPLSGAINLLPKTFPCVTVSVLPPTVFLPKVRGAALANSIFGINKITVETSRSVNSMLAMCFWSSSLGITIIFITFISLRDRNGTLLNYSQIHYSPGHMGFWLFLRLIAIKGHKQGKSKTDFFKFCQKWGFRKNNRLDSSGYWPLDQC